MITIGLFTKKKVEKGANAISILDEGTKADILAFYELDGMKPSEIAAETGVDVARVSKLLELNKRKQARIVAREATPPPRPDPLREKELEIAQLRLDQQKRQLEWEMEDREYQRKLDIEEEEEERKNSQADMIDATTRGGIPWGQIISMFAGGFFKGKQQMQMQQNLTPSIRQNPTLAEPAQENELATLSDDQIQEIIDRYPKEFIMIQRMPDYLILTQAKQRFPGYTEDTYQRALSKIKSFEQVTA